MSPKIVLFWHRRDLRLHDNAGLYHALRSGYPVLPVFFFDTDILDCLEDKRDRRVEFIHQALLEMQQELVGLGASLLVRHGQPVDLMRGLLEEYDVAEVHTNHDYEPYAARRDGEVAQLLQAKGIAFRTHKDQTIFEKNEVLAGGGKPYTVFTPYSRCWKRTLNDSFVQSYPNDQYFGHFLPSPPLPIPSLPAMGFEPVGIAFPPREVRDDILEGYQGKRDFPGTQGTSRLSVHLRFGTVSIRTLARRAAALSETWLNELIWRDFYMMIMWHFPRVYQEPFRKEFENVGWRNDEEEFGRWCEGQTGYPLVDAGMRELNTTGFMHNRVRMVVASFVVKHLLIDWRWGEAYFGRKLLDYDLAANNGGWQWAAGSGTDAAPYFRVFNPARQAQKFDPEEKYIRQWVPELGTPDYPTPMVDHAFARERALKVFKEALSKTPAAK
ncbi:MAG: deoxyribodipyrimidine photo-lyase [Ferruginibacter sp.]|nr:deoxyribodipyrimidine photo-lyase [Cytophagales bacterium]